MFGFPDNNTCGQNQVHFVLHNPLGPTVPYVPFLPLFLQQINLPMMEDWPAFYKKNRLDFQMGLINARYKDQDLQELYDSLQEIYPKLFQDLTIRPALIHGDLWAGNWSYDTNGVATIFDPAVSHSHSEAELGIMSMFGTMSPEFHAAYHALIPKEKGFKERQHLYQLYHYLNHYSLFGGSYRESCMHTLRKLVKA